MSAVALRSVDDDIPDHADTVDAEALHQWKAIAAALSERIGVPISTKSARRLEQEQGLRVRRIYLFGKPVIVLDPDECARFAAEVLARTAPPPPPPALPGSSSPVRKYRHRSK